MNEELIFRLVFWALLIIFILANRVIPLLVAKSREEKIVPDKGAIENEGKATFLIRVVLGIIFGAFLIFYAIYPSFMNVLQIRFPLLLKCTGVIIAILGEIAWIYSQTMLNRYWSPHLQLQKNHRIIQTGPYRYIRHPIYSSMFAWCIGISMLTANSFLIAFSIIAIVMMIIRIPKEEKMLLQEFGDEYKGYMEKTGRIFPRIRKIAK